MAANLPDADLLYSNIMPAPLGYLLHHRGHTHTVVGLIVLAVLIAVVVAAIPRVRATIAGREARFALVVAASLASHLVADSWNSYGVHPFYPLDSRWYYGDAVFIVEPWLWALLGVSVVASMRSDRGRLALAGLLVALPIAGAAIGLLPAPTLLPIAVVAGVMYASLRRRAPRTRAVVSLACTTLFVIGLFGLRQRARAQVEAAFPAAGAVRLVDLVLSPRPGNPLCWSAISVVRDDAADALVYRRGTIAVAAGMLPARACGADAAVSWGPESRQSVAALTALARRDCWTRAWLQFARTPLAENGSIADYRFGGSGRDNFTSMPLPPPDSTRACPRHLTPWVPPRAG